MVKKETIVEKDKINIGILGVANIAKRSILPALHAMPSFNITAIASRDLAKAQTVAKDYNCLAVEGYNQLLKMDNIDAVYIPLPTGLHYQWIKKSLKANKHVLTEKSLTTNFAHTQEVIALAKAKSLLILEDFMFQFHQQHRFVKQLIQDGVIGDLRCFRTSFACPAFSDKDNIRYQKKLGGGALLDVGAYTLKAAQLFLGYDLKVSSSFLKYDKNHKVDVSGGALLTAPNDVFAQVAFGFEHFYQCNYEIWGSEGKIIAERAFTPSPTFKPSILVEKQGTRHKYRISADNHFVNILQEFARAIHAQDFEKHYQEGLNQSRLVEEVLGAVVL